MRAEFREYTRQKIMTLRYGDKRTGVALEPVFMDALHSRIQARHLRHRLDPAD